MNIEEVLGEIKAISEDLCKEHLEPFCASLDELATSEVKDDNANQRGHIRILADNIKPSLQAIIAKENDLLQKHLTKVTQKRADVEKLLQVQEQLRLEDEKQEKQLQKLRKQCQSYKEKLNNLQNLKDCILTHKIITGTHFAFKKGHVTGYIKHPKTSHFEVFDFNTSEVSQQDITKKLCSLLKNISKEDYDNQIKYTTNNNKKVILG